MKILPTQRPLDTYTGRDVRRAVFNEHKAAFSTGPLSKVSTGMDDIKIRNFVLMHLTSPSKTALIRFPKPTDTEETGHCPIWRLSPQRAIRRFTPYIRMAEKSTFPITIRRPPGGGRNVALLVSLPRILQRIATLSGVSSHTTRPDYRGGIMDITTTFRSQSRGHPCHPSQRR